MAIGAPDRHGGSVVPGPSRISLLGLPIDAFTHCDLVERVFGDLDSGNGGYIMTANLDNLRGITRDDTLRSLALTADVRVADGMPLLWASRLRGTPLPDRVAGSDLILTLSEAAAQRRRSVFLLGGSPGTADRAGEALCKMFAGLEIAGTCCPDLRSPEPAEELERIRAVLEQAGPDIVFIGLPFPKASVLVGVLREHISATWFLGLGISFSFICGDIHLAPRWMQSAGLEWLHRLMQEPRRLFKRYIIEGMPFIVTLLSSALADRPWDAGPLCECVRRYSSLRPGDQASDRLHVAVAKETGGGGVGPIPPRQFSAYRRAVARSPAAKPDPTEHSQWRPYPRFAPSFPGRTATTAALVAAAMPIASAVRAAASLPSRFA